MINTANLHDPSIPPVSYWQFACPCFQLRLSSPTYPCFSHMMYHAATTVIDATTSSTGSLRVRGRLLEAFELDSLLLDAIERFSTPYGPGSRRKKSRAFFGNRAETDQRPISARSHRTTLPARPRIAISGLSRRLAQESVCCYSHSLARLYGEEKKKEDSVSGAAAHPTS